MSAVMDLLRKIRSLETLPEIDWREIDAAETEYLSTKASLDTILGDAAVIGTRRGYAPFLGGLAVLHRLDDELDSAQSFDHHLPRLPVKEINVKSTFKVDGSFCNCQVSMPSSESTAVKCRACGKPILS